MNVSDVMRKGVIAVPQTSSLRDLITLFFRHRVDTLPVVDNAGRVVGLVTLAELVHIFMPKFTEFVKDFAFLDDFGVLEPVFLSQSQLIMEDKLFLVADIMNQTPILIREHASLLEASALMAASHIERLSVVNDHNRLLGVITHVDIVLSLLAGKPITHYSEEQAVS